MEGDSDGGNVEEGEDSEGGIEGWREGERAQRWRTREGASERVKWATLFMFSGVEYLI